MPELHYDRVLNPEVVARRAKVIAAEAIVDESQSRVPISVPLVDMAIGETFEHAKRSDLGLAA